MNKKLLIYIACILLMLCLVSIGFYIYTITFVTGSFSGLNPYGLVSLGVSIIASWIVFVVARSKGVFPYN